MECFGSQEEIILVNQTDHMLSPTASGELDGRCARFFFFPSHFLNFQADQRTTSCQFPLNIPLDVRSLVTAAWTRQQEMVAAARCPTPGRKQPAVDLMMRDSRGALRVAGLCFGVD